MSIDTAPAPVERYEFSSTDSAEITDYIDRMYAGNRTRFLDVPPEAAFAARGVATDTMATDRVHSAIGYATDAEPFEYLVFEHLIAGRYLLRGGEELLMRPGDVAMVPMGVGLSFEVHDLDMSLLRLPMDRVAAAAEGQVGAPAGGLRFHSAQPVSHAMGRYWRELVGVVHRELMDPDSSMCNPLVAEQTTAGIAAAALTTFPNTAMTVDYIRDPGPITPMALRRAIDHINANADQPLTLTDIADAGGVTTCALQHDFRRHYDTTPLGYLRRVRLERAHAELTAAEPETGQTVAAIAERWGFAHPARFAAAYTVRYGRPPTDTLHA
ncbi:AraC family transcriptional regulator [Nocardia sp. NBC_00508]|uniref:AraC family transcriptional regulator n=1 Tax=Nocardia sp. NBC_00508 TaxID=2975992 RepID=UPI002E821EEC|nr:AraC family transcriptional regulator [Nocardia sp. NBC_00508]WUD66779.1 AraC family transcriptional regulator [Nocardia sp. NBC_00508]